MLDNGQDYDILLTLCQSDNPLTAYAIGKDAGIAVAQVNYRLTKLLNVGVVTAIQEKNRTVYSTHPILKSRKDVEDIACLLADIIRIITEAGEIEEDGVKKVLAFIVDRIRFIDPTDKNGEFEIE